MIDEQFEAIAGGIPEEQARQPLRLPLFFYWDGARDAMSPCLSETFHKEAEVPLASGRGLLVDADTELERPYLKPHPAAMPELLRVFCFGKAKDRTVNSGAFPLQRLWHGNLDVIDAD